MNIFIHFFILIFLTITTCSEVQAIQEPIKLGTIIVTAERFPVEERENPRFVTVVTSQELKETGANNIVDALKRTGGLAYRAFAPLGISHGGMNSSLPIRGIKDGELVLINGVPIQGAAGHAYDLNAIPINQIERVEILKGAASTIYGADAMSGVINIITKTPKEKTALKGSVEFGNESYHNHSLSILYPRINIGLNYKHLGDQREISRSYTQKYRYDLAETNKFAMNLNAKLIENLYLDYLASYYDTGFQKHYDGNAKPYEGTDQDHRKHFGDIRYETDSFRAKGFVMYGELQRDEYTIPNYSQDENKNYNLGLEGDWRMDLHGWKLNLGADWIYRGANYNNKYGEHHRNDYAMFFQVKRTLWDRLTPTLGFREQFVDSEPGTDDYDRFLPSFGLTFKANKNINLFANAGKAFRAPTFNNLYYESNFLVGNPTLGPEEGWTYEAGLKYDASLFRLRFAGFFMTYKDKIEIDRSKGYPLTYFNAGDYESKGIEWEIDVNPFIHQDGWQNNLLFYLTGYWADPTAEDVNGKEYQTGPKFQNTLGMSYQSAPLILDLNCQILTSREWELDSYAVLNFSGKSKLERGYLTFAVDNIFNEEVQVSGDLSPEATNRYVYYDLERLIKVGYEITF